MSKPLTESDPIVTRVAVARSDNGSRFGMFLEVFADGTVLDADGVHKVGPEVVRALSKAITEGELLRRRGHCGAPSTDFVEVYHVTTFERSGRTLRANTFSYTGDPRGCDPSVAKLHAAMEKLVMKLSGVPASAATAGAGLASPPPTSPTLSPNLAPLNGPTNPPSSAQPIPTQSPAAPSSDQPPDLLPALPPMSAPSPTTIPLTPLPE